MTCTAAPIVCTATHARTVACPGCYDGCACRLTPDCRMRGDVCVVHDAPEHEHAPGLILSGGDR